MINILVISHIYIQIIPLEKDQNDQNTSIKHQKNHLMTNAAVGKKYFLDKSTSNFFNITKGYSFESPLKSMVGTLE